MLAISAIICFFAGIASGLLGIGGGLIMVPLFRYFLGMNLHQAIGTSLFIIVPTALAGALRHGSGYSVNWRIACFASLFSILGAILGAGVSLNLDETLLKKIFAGFLVLVALKMFFE